MEHAPLKHHAIGQTAFKGAVDRFFGRHGGQLRVIANHQGGGQGLVHQFVQSHHPADQARALGLGGIHHAPGQGQIHRLGLAHRTRQALGTTSARDDAQLDLGLAELGVVGGDDEVAHHRQLATPAQGKTADRRNHRFAHRADGFPVAGDEILCVHIGKVVAGHGTNVGPSGKGFFAAGDDHAANGGVGVIGLERGAQLVHQLAVQGIELLGPVEGDHPDLVGVGGGLDGLVGHGVSGKNGQGVAWVHDYTQGKTFTNCRVG